MNEQHRKIVENYVQSYNSFDVAGMIKHMHENIVFENISNGKVDLRTEGLTDFKKQAEAAAQYFQERSQTIESWEFDGPKVSITIDYKATLAVDLPNGFRKGDTLALQGTSVFEFENGKIKSIIDKS